MTLIDFRPRWRIGLRLPCSLSVALPLVVDVLSGVPMGVCSPGRHACSAGAFALHFAWHPLWFLRCTALHTSADVHALRRASPCADCLPQTYPARDIAGVRRQAGCQQHSAPGPPMPGATARGKGGGQDKRSRHVVARKSSLHVGAARHALVAAPCRVDRQYLVGIEPSACLARLAATALDGGSA